MDCLSPKLGIVAAGVILFNLSAFKFIVCTNHVFCLALTAAMVEDVVFFMRILAKFVSVSIGTAGELIVDK